MKKMLICALALLLVLSLTGCTIILPGSRQVSATDLSATDVVSASDETEADTDDSSEDEDFDFVITYRAIAAAWETAADDTAYLAAAQERLDEYTLLITSLGTMQPELAARCSDADEVRRDEAYLPLSAAFVQWSANVANYDTSLLTEPTSAVHEKLVALAELTDEYIELFPSICMSSDLSENDSYLDEILTLMMEIDSLLQ